MHSAVLRRFLKTIHSSGNGVMAPIKITPNNHLSFYVIKPSFPILHITPNYVMNQCATNQNVLYFGLPRAHEGVTISKLDTCPCNNNFITKLFFPIRYFTRLKCRKRLSTKVAVVVNYENFNIIIFYYDLMEKCIPKIHWSANTQHPLELFTTPKLNTNIKEYIDYEKILAS